MSLDIHPEDILQWETKKLWNTLNSLKNDEDAQLNQENYYSIKHGLRIKIPIWYITEEWYEIYPSSKKVKIQGHGKFWLKDFMQEKEDRDSLMRSEILKNIDDGNMMEART